MEKSNIKSQLRSASICLAYLLQEQKRSLREIIMEVKQKRTIVKPNYSFMKELVSKLVTNCFQSNK